MKKLTYLFLLFTNFFFAQVLDKYPEGQFFYEGGVEKFYSDIHKVIVEKNIKPCENKNEIYFAKILVTNESKVKFIKDFDSVSIAKNKCAYNLTLDLIKELDGYKAPEVKNYKVSSVADFIIFPNDLFDGYKENYNPNHFIIPALYKKGKDKFNKDFHDSFMALFSDYHINGNLILDFTIDENGKIINPIVSPKIENRTFAQEFLRALERLNNKWTPALYKGIPVKYQISVPMNFSTEFYEK